MLLSKISAYNMGTIVINKCTRCHRLHDESATKCRKCPNWELKKVDYSENVENKHQLLHHCTICRTYLECFVQEQSCCNQPSREIIGLLRLPKEYICKSDNQKNDNLGNSDLGDVVNQKIQRAKDCITTLENLNLMTLKPEQLETAEKSMEEMVQLNRLFINGFTECKEYQAVKEIHASLGPLVDTMKKLLKLTHLINKEGAMEKLEKFLECENGVEITTV